MSHSKIIKCLDKVNGRFLTELDQGQKEQAVEQFKLLWSEQKEKVNSIINRKHKAVSNLQTQEKELTAHAKKMALDLQERMLKNQKKRSVLQLQKLKFYRHMDRVWKERVTQITLNLKKQQKQKYSKAQQLSKQSEAFWQNKRSNKSSPRRSLRQSQEISPKRSNKYSPSHDFLTEFSSKSRGTIEKRRNARSSVKDGQFDLKMQERVPESKSLNIQRRKVNHIDPHLIKWNNQVKQSQEAHFQKAMKKIDIILKRRIKTREALLEHSRQAKISRELKNNMYFHNEKRYKSQRFSNSLHGEMNNRQQRNNVSAALMPYHNLTMQQKRKELEEESFRLRTQMMEREKKKERRGTFHRMVSDAVKLCRFQTLKKKL